MGFFGPALGGWLLGFVATWSWLGEGLKIFTLGDFIFWMNHLEGANMYIFSVQRTLDVEMSSIAYVD